MGAFLKSVGKPNKEPPMLITDTAGSPAAGQLSAVTLPADLSLSPPPDGADTVRHLLLGDPGRVRQTIHLLHSLHYVEQSQWSLVLEVPKQLIITPEQGAYISMLTKRLKKSVPKIAF